MSDSESKMEWPERLKLTTCLGANTEPVGRAVARYLEERLSLPAEFVANISWAEREKCLNEGQIHAGWVCGLLYAWSADQAESPFELLAAPIIRGRRYGGRPVYYSDVIVHRQSPFHTFEELRGSSCAYNEVRSYSGYFVLRQHLARLGETEGYFRQAIASGAHHSSIQMVCRGEADAASIDSTILDWELAQDPELGALIRTVQILGPSPVPPWVISREAPAGLRGALQEALLTMHENPQGKAALALGQVSRFAAVSDPDYKPIRTAVSEAGGASL